MEFTISLNNLHFYAFIGVAEEERSIGNEFIVSLDVALPFSTAIENDNLEATVSYDDLYAIVEEEMKLKRKLLEKTATEIAKKVKSNFPVVTEGVIRIEKVRPPIPGMLGTASVSLKF